MNVLMLYILKLKVYLELNVFSQCYFYSDFWLLLLMQQSITANI